MSLFSRTPAKKLASAKEALAAAEGAAVDAAQAFEADPTEKTATAKLVADQRAVNARRAVVVAESDVADAHRAELAAELADLLKEIGLEAHAAFEAAEIDREVTARSVLQDKWIAAEAEARERNFRCNRARQIATELGQGTNEIDSAQHAWRNVADHVAAEVTDRLGKRTATLDGGHDSFFLRRSVSWTAPTLRR
ncbi:MAG TPA: hypothetical protein PLU22_00910 [Polyangiaceae bacterium]|nr:hypothetical protein [Polyangiaceae bacterium]